MNFVPTTTYESGFEELTLFLLRVGAFTPLVGLLLAFLLAALGQSLMDTARKRKIVGVVAVLFIAVGLGAGAVGINLTNSDQHKAIRADQSANLVTNLKTKYEIKDVSFDKDEYSKLRIQNGGTLPPQPDRAYEQTIIVTLENDEKAIFRVTQDENTSEPTLTELLPGATVVPVESIARN